MAELILENGKIVYNKIKELYVKSYGNKGFFFQDYFKDEIIGKDSFISDLINNEPQLNLCEELSSDDIETVWEHIQDGISSSNRIMNQVDSVTDKFIGDNSF